VLIHPTNSPDQRSELAGGMVLVQWDDGSRLQWNGIEEAVISIDWSQGAQAVQSAMKKWFQQHKRHLLRLKSEAKLPSSGSYFRLRDETGRKTPRRIYLAALRGLGAMRQLGRHTLPEAIETTKGYGTKGGSLYWGFTDAGQPMGRTAWLSGIENARKRFHELFYPRDERSLRIRRCYGLPEIEEPISYRRYCSRTGKNK